MENFLSAFSNANTTISSSNVNIKVSPEFYGYFEIKKGLLSMQINFYARVYESKYENIISLDDWDVQDRSDITFNGIPIDNLDKLKESMINSGLSTLASKIQIDDNEFKIEIANQIQNAKIFKSIFGKNAIMLETLSEEDKYEIKLKYAIDNYNIVTINSHELKELIISNEDGSKSIPSLESLKETYKNLIKK